MIVTHEVEVARKTASRVVYMENGHIVEQGDAALPSRKPKHLKTISLTKIRDNNNEKSSDCRVNCRF